VQVGVADTAAVNANENLGALRLRTFDDGLAQRCGIGGERLAAELGHGRILAPRSGERAGECDKSFDRNLLGPLGCLDAGGGKQRERIHAERFQALA
jgi:hypothetical protein